MKRNVQPKLDIVGKKFNLLTVTNEYEKIPNGTKWKCICDCGNITWVYRGKLTTGVTKSCGCLNHRLKGLSKHPLYKVWWSMKERCYSPNHHAYHNYGGRGIQICGEWLEDFLVFYDWSMANGYEEGLSIDRINNDEDYADYNCQWITLSENVAKANENKPKRKTLYKYYGISPTGEKIIFENAEEFAREYNLNAKGIRRVAKGERNQYKGWSFGFTDIPNNS